MKVRDVIKRLRREGWRLDHTTGDHRVFKHPERRGNVILSGHPNEDIPPGTLVSIERQAGWREPR